MRVVVAMSGGVDSSVVAGLLHEAGHEVIGVTLQLYDHGAATGRKGACCAGQDIHDARRVADRLGIPHYVIDAEQRFAGTVIKGFADSYANGETPVPCITCNQTVKFADLSALARDLGAERLATGHYVRRMDGPDGAELHRAADPARDQSWFLFATTRAAAGHVPVPPRRHAKTSEPCAMWPSGSVLAWRKSRTARISASSPRAPIRMSSPRPVPTRSSRARSSPPRDASSAATTGSRATRWGRASVWAMPRCWMGSARSWSPPNRDAGASSWDRAGRASTR